MFRRRTPYEVVLESYDIIRLKLCQGGRVAKPYLSNILLINLCTGSKQYASLDDKERVYKFSFVYLFPYI